MTYPWNAPLTGTDASMKHQRSPMGNPHLNSPARQRGRGCSGDAALCLRQIEIADVQALGEIHRVTCKRRITISLDIH